jgi:hypothetical protein
MTMLIVRRIVPQECALRKPAGKKKKQKDFCSLWQLRHSCWTGNQELKVFLLLFRKTKEDSVLF